MVGHADFRQIYPSCIGTKPEPSIESEDSRGGCVRTWQSLIAVLFTSLPDGEPKRSSAAAIPAWLFSRSSCGTFPRRDRYKNYQRWKRNREFSRPLGKQLRYPVHSTRRTIWQCFFPSMRHKRICKFGEQMPTLLTGRSCQSMVDLRTRFAGRGSFSRVCWAGVLFADCLADCWFMFESFSPFHRLQRRTQCRVIGRLPFAGLPRSSWTPRPNSAASHLLSHPTMPERSVGRNTPPARRPRRG